MSHTPGPWWSDGTAIFLGNGSEVWARGDPAYMCELSYLDEDPHISEEEQVGNARLIAAAPDLLAAVRAYEEASCGTEHEALAAAILKGRAAIAKAEGKE